MRQSEPTSVAIFFIFLILLVAAGAAPAGAGQQYILSGVVHSAATGAPITDEVDIMVDGKRSKFEPSLAGEYRAYLTPGKHSLTFSRRGYAGATVEIDLGDIVNHEFMIYRNVGLEPIARTARLSGVVRSLATGRTVPFARIALNSEIFFADDEGYFEMDSYPGTQSVRVTARGFFPLKNVFGLEAGESRRLDVVLRKCTFYGRIRGRVAEKTTHEAICGAVIEIDGERTASGMDGAFEFDFPGSGEKEVVCAREGYATIKAKVKLRAGDNMLKIYMKNGEKRYLSGKTSGKKAKR